MASIYGAVTPTYDCIRRDKKWLK